ncbi:hypothetical protein RFI_01807, partial [Reticulomyxa filosa]
MIDLIGLIPNTHHSPFELTVMCHATVHPSKAPTHAPTLPPTVNQPPKWTLCPNKHLFSFSKNESNQTVFWSIPQAIDSQAITVELWQQVYTCIDLKDTLHKVSMNKSTTTLDYCIHSSFSINVVINEDDYTLVNTDQQQYTVDNGITISKVYLVDLVAKRQNCYVRAQFVRQVSPKTAQTATSTYLGIKGHTVAWQIVILVFVICVLALAVEAVRRCVREYRAAHKKEADSTKLIRDVDATTEEKEAMTGVAPANSMQKGTSQSINGPGAANTNANANTNTNTNANTNTNTNATDETDGVAIEIQTTDNTEAPASPGKAGATAVTSN